WTRSEPAVLGDDLEPADRGVITRSVGQRGLNLLSGKLRGPDLVRRELRQQFLLRWRRSSVDALEARCAELPRELAIGLAGIAPGAGGNLRGQQGRRHSVL